MTKVHLTDMAIKNLPVPAQGQVMYWDDALPGFGIRVSQGGLKSFYLVHGKARQKTQLGRYPIASLSAARARAKEILAERTLGMHRMPAMSFSKALELYLAGLAKRNKASSFESTRRRPAHEAFSATLRRCTAGEDRPA
jgi:hypothetical protein